MVLDFGPGFLREAFKENRGFDIRVVFSLLQSLVEGGQIMDWNPDKCEYETILDEKRAKVIEPYIITWKKERPFLPEKLFEK